jgi:uncharacterized protein YqgQ
MTVYDTQFLKKFQGINFVPTIENEIAIIFFSDKS